MLKYFTQFKEAIDRAFESRMTPVERYLLIREKTHYYLFLETMIRRLDTDRIKGTITK